MDKLENLNLQEIKLREKIQKLNSKKWSVLKLVFICLIIIFGLPFTASPRLGGVQIENNVGNIDTKIISSLLISMIVIPIVIYGYLLSCRREMKRLEFDLEKIITEKKKLK